MVSTDKSDIGPNTINVRKLGTGGMWGVYVGDIILSTHRGRDAAATAANQLPTLQAGGPS